MPELAERGRAALKPLWACWRALDKARAKREPLDLDLPERRVVLDEKGRILSVAPRERLDAHKLIEDYMIAANVAAAKALEAKKAPVMYRVHEPPSREKLVALKDYLKTFGIEFALGQVITPGDLQPHPRRGSATPISGRRSWSRCCAPRPRPITRRPMHGHFGLALGSYAHFTSPIRRYADLLVHRSLVGAYRARPRRADRRRGGGDGADRRDDLACSSAARWRPSATRSTAMSPPSSPSASARWSMRGSPACSNFGFFATVEGIGGDGLVPVRDLGSEYFRYDEAARELVGEETGTTYASGQRLKLRLAEANPVSGALRFELLDEVDRRGRRRASRASRVTDQAARAAGEYPASIRRGMISRELSNHVTPVKAGAFPARAG